MRSHLSCLAALLAFATFSAIQPASSAAQAGITYGDIYTIAGSGVAGYTGDGQAAYLARLHTPKGIAFDPSGNLYIADELNNVIRKVDKSTGVISTYAGGGTCFNGPSWRPSLCGDGGPATGAELAYPRGIAFDASGNLYIADTSNQAIRMVSASTQVISTFAGNGVEGYSADGVLRQNAELENPFSLAFDSTGNLYYLEYGANTLREISASTGALSTVAGAGPTCSQATDFYGDGCPAAQSGFAEPVMIQIDGKGNLYVLDQNEFYGVLREISATTGTITAAAGNYDGSDYSCQQSSDLFDDGCPANNVPFDAPGGVVIDSAGDFYVALQSGAYYTSAVQKVSASTGLVSFAVGDSAANCFACQGYSGDGGPANQATLDNPTFVAFDAEGNLYIADSSNNAIREVIYSEITPPPAFSPAGGTYNSPQSVTISDSNAPSGTVTYFTLDGSPPTANSTQYSGPIEVSSTAGPTTINAISIAPGYYTSPVASATYTIQLPAATPTFSPTGGKYDSAQLVTISDATNGATIYYTTNGANPTVSSTRYSKPIKVEATEIISAMAVATGYAESAVASATYKIELPAATPAFSPAAGTYYESKSVKIADATPNAAIYYTTNGSAPSTSSKRYTSAITVSKNESIKAIAVATGYTESAVASATYKIELPAATPVFSPAGGTYSESKTVKITDTTPGAAIYYTTNGSEPTTSSKKYTSAITVSSNETIKAIAVAAGYSESAVTTAVYKIKR
jgi:hypothetical protein